MTTPLEKLSCTFRNFVLLTLLSTNFVVGFGQAKSRKLSEPRPFHAVISNMGTNADNENLIMVVGSANQDLTSNTDVLPSMGETVMGKDFATACGGKGANQAVAAASLGFAPVAMVCRVGDDLFGQNLLSNFRTYKRVFEIEYASNLIHFTRSHDRPIRYPV